jgi:hypothetical protein
MVYLDTSTLEFQKSIKLPSRNPNEITGSFSLSSDETKVAYFDKNEKRCDVLCVYDLVKNTQETLDNEIKLFLYSDFSHNYHLTGDLTFSKNNEFLAYYQVLKYGKPENHVIIFDLKNNKIHSEFTIEDFNWPQFTFLNFTLNDNYLHVFNRGEDRSNTSYIYDLRSKSIIDIKTWDKGLLFSRNIITENELVAMSLSSNKFNHVDGTNVHFL